MNSLKEIKEHIDSTHVYRSQSYEAIVALDIKMTRTVDSKTGIPISIPVSWGLCADNEFFYFSTNFEELKKFLDSFYYKLVIWTYWLGNLYYNIPVDIFGEEPEIITGANSKFFPLQITANNLIFRDSRELSKMTLEEMMEELDFPDTNNSVAIICKWITLLKDLIGVDKIIQLPYSQGKLYRAKLAFHEVFNKQGYAAMYTKSKLRYTEIWKDKETYNKFHKGFKNGLITRNTRKDGQKIKNILYADITSAYPAVMVSKKLPWSFTKINIKEPKDFNFYTTVFKHPTKELCFFGKFTFTNLSLKKEAPCATVMEDTKFVFYSPVYSSYMTDIEYQIICKFYNFDSVVCEDMYKSELRSLDKREMEVLYDLFDRKQEAADTPQYRFYKILLNAAFGNKCRRMEMTDYEYNCEDKDYYYPEGVWISAIQRKIMADIIWELGEDFIYTNTDSIVCNDTPRAREIIEDYNARIQEKELGKFKIEKFKEFYMVGPSKYCLWKNNREKKIVFAGIHQNNGNLTPEDLENYYNIGQITIKEASSLPVYLKGPFTVGDKTIKQTLFLRTVDKTFVKK